MTWQENLEKDDLETWMSYQSGAHCHEYDIDECILMVLIEDFLDASGHMWSIYKMRHPKYYQIRISLGPDEIIEVHADSRIEALVAGWLALKRAKA